jgi:hypothetical protein
MVFFSFFCLHFVCFWRLIIFKLFFSISFVLHFVCLNYFQSKSNWFFSLSFVYILLVLGGGLEEEGGEPNDNVAPPVAISEEAVAQLTAMGFSDPAARRVSLT